MRNRLAQLRFFLPKLKVDALFVSDPVNIRYLTGHAAEDGWLLVTALKAFYITDFRYIAIVKQVFKNQAIDIVQFDRSLFESVIQAAIEEKVGILGFEENNLTYYQFSRLKSCVKKRLKLRALSGTVEALRVVKSPQEVSSIREAIRINLKGFEWIARFIRPGVTEKDIYYQLQNFIRVEGVDFSFPPIIASGPNSAYPHARITERKLCLAEPVLLDFGVEKNGYKSDLTRMFFLGKMPRSFEKRLSLIRNAQEEAYKVIRLGVPSQAVDAAARGFLERNGLAQYFGHSLGHGVGLQTHEMPRVSSKSGEILLENMIITIEPGVYFPGRYGVRLEEMVLVGSNGCEVISNPDF